MAEPSTYSYPRYLDAKTTVDARALNHRVWSRFIESLAGSPSSPVRILEVGGGVGATVKRVVEALEPHTDALHFTFVDREAENVEAAREELRTWARNRGYSVSKRDSQVWNDGPIEVSIRFMAADLFNVAADHNAPAYDALIGQAVFDLLSISDAFRSLAPLMSSEGLWYLPIHFDGVTMFEPSVDPELDARIERLFHASMSHPDDSQNERAGAQCGRRLLRHIHDAETDLLEVGSSDWVVSAQDGTYPRDEAYFLHHILHFVETELRGHPNLPHEAFSDWVAARRRQVETGTLIYITHQLDVLAQGA